MASTVNFRVLHYSAWNVINRPRSRAKVHSLAGSSGDSKVLSSDSDVIDWNGTAAAVVEKERIESLSIKGGNGRAGCRILEKKKERDIVFNELEVLYDDGYGEETVKDYLEVSQDIIKPDGGPPRWFCPSECGRPVKGAPTLLFLPGLDGVGLGLILHHKPLGKAFEVWCLHIPVNDRTPFEGLVQLVEDTVRLEHASFPNKPIYLVGDSFGGCLALAVAARNPTIDLVLILVNPATSFGRSQLQPLLPILEGLPDGLHFAVPYLLSFIMGEPVKMAMVNIDSRRPSAFVLEELSRNLTALLPRLSGLSSIIPKDTLLWKLKLLWRAAAYANSRLHAIKAEVLVLVSGKDNMLPSRDEAKRLSNSLKNCRVRNFKDNGHTLLLVIFPATVFHYLGDSRLKAIYLTMMQEDGINLMSVIKGTCLYRRSRRRDYVSEFLPPSMSEYRYAFDQTMGSLRFATSPVTFSTREDGTIVKGLSAVPNQGPVLLVGYHMLMGLEIYSLVEEFLKQKNIVVRGIAHPQLFSGIENPDSEFSVYDLMKVFGALPVASTNFFKLLQTKSHVLLYPGGAREALHNKGEQYKLFWPEQPEFVRMAARFGATIIPFGTVGEDDIAELVLDYEDLMRIPILNDYIRDQTRDVVKLREDSQGEVANQKLYLPGLLPKIPGRFYYLFGKPIHTKGKEEMLKDRGAANEMYLQIKSDVERSMAYLLKKREQDPYRGIVDRTLYRAIYGSSDEVPAFEP